MALVLAEVVVEPWRGVVLRLPGERPQMLTPGYARELAKQLFEAADKAERPGVVTVGPDTPELDG